MGCQTDKYYDLALEVYRLRAAPLDCPLADQQDGGLRPPPTNADWDPALAGLLVVDEVPLCKLPLNVGKGPTWEYAFIYAGLRPLFGCVRRALAGSPGGSRRPAAWWTTRRTWTRRTWTT